MKFDKDLKEACRENCAEFGDPPCWEIDPGCDPCKECRLEVGDHIPEPLDPNAVVRPLL